MTKQGQSKEVKQLQQKLNDAIEENGAMCEGYTEEFYCESSDRQSITMAKFICASCPIQQVCQEYALIAQEEYGIWGGLTPEERKWFYVDHKKLARRKRWLEKRE